MAEQTAKTSSEVQSTGIAGTPIHAPQVDYGSVAHAATQAEGEVNQIIQKERTLAAQATADDTSVMFAQQGAKELSAYTRTKFGQAALDTQPTLDAIEKTRNEISVRIKDPLARQLYESASRRRFENMAAQIEAHASSEGVKWKVNSAKGVADQAVIDSASAIPTDMTEGGGQAALDTLSKTAGDLVPVYRAATEVLSLSPGQAAQQVRSHVANNVKAAVGTAIAVVSEKGVESANAAKAGIEVLDGAIEIPGVGSVLVAEILGKEAASLRAKLVERHTNEQGRVEGLRVFEQSRSLISRFSNDPRAVRDESVTNPMFEEIKDPAIRLAARKQYDALVTGESKEKQSRLNKVAFGLNKQVDHMYSTTGIINETAIFGSPTWAQIEGTEQGEKLINRIRSFKSERRAVSNSPEYSPESQRNYNVFWQSYDNGRNPKFTGADGLEEFDAEFAPGMQHGLHPKDYYKAKSYLVSDIRVKNDPAFVKGYAAEAQAEFLKIAPGKKMDEAVEFPAFKEAVRNVQETVRIAAEKYGHNDTPEVRKAYDEVMKEYRRKIVTNPGFFWDSHGPAFTAPDSVPRPVREPPKGASAAAADDKEMQDALLWYTGHKTDPDAPAVAEILRKKGLLK